jgi:hypothetical protein
VRAALALSLLVTACSAACSSNGCNHATESKSPSLEAGKDELGADLTKKLRDALLAKGSSYVPRTRHVNADGTPKFTNRLLLESSPYLLQHAHNPVNWYPWGEEAFDKARALNRPVFLSIGYSTCHWCHVMEEESFEDLATAQYLNDHYICIKVDREERPDIDAVYMAFVQGFTGNGGWPMNVWLTPARAPFFGGTYFPPAAGPRGGKSFGDVLSLQMKRYAVDPEGVTKTAADLVKQLQRETALESGAASTCGSDCELPPASILEKARAKAAERFDPANGGARGAPKFPSSFPTRLLLRADGDTKKMALTTLERMQSGGIHDHVGGGFHRYSTDAKWLTPHFEKMLYDNAQLAIAYLEGAQASGDARLLATAREILEYLLREMSAPNGLFYAATDADSPAPNGKREEGLFFTWTPEDLSKTLGDDARVAAAWFGVSLTPNFEGRTILSTPRSLDDVAKELQLSPAELDAKIPSIRARLLTARSHRPPPLRDDKILVAWNALTVSALARAAISLGDAHYAEAATRAATALYEPVRAGRALPHELVDGREKGRAFADDYAYLAAALIDVFEMTSNRDWLFAASALMEELEKTFRDEQHGGYYTTAETANQSEKLFLRERAEHDGPTPTVSSVAAMNWLRLATFMETPRLDGLARRTLHAFEKTLTETPLALDVMLLALDYAHDPTREIVIVVPEGRGALAPTARPFLDVLSKRLAPNAVLVAATEQDLEGELGRAVPWIADKRAKGGKATAYLCRGRTCQLPTTDPAVFSAQIEQSYKTH